jgi:glutathione S-transferase
MTLTLYGGARSRASLVRWYLEEKGLPYIWIPIDLAKGEQQEPAFRAINPFGKVPALLDSSFSLRDGQPVALFESGAILLHLSEHHAKESGATVLRSLTAQWLFYANATLGPALVSASTRPKELIRQLEVLEPLMATGHSLLAALPDAPAWGAADCAVQAYLAYLPLFCKEIDLSPFPAIQTTIGVTQVRRAYRTAMGLPPTDA